MTFRTLVLAAVATTTLGAAARAADRSMDAGSPRVQSRGDSPAPTEGDFVVRDFRFGTAETLPSLNLHCRTRGTPRRDAAGAVRTAARILPGTGGPADDSR